MNLPKLNSSLSNSLKLLVRNFSVCQTKFTSKPQEKPLQKGLLLGAYNGCERVDVTPSPIAERFGGEINFNFKDALTGQIGLGEGEVRIFDNLTDEFRAVAVVGMGPEPTEDQEKENVYSKREFIRNAAGAGAQALQERGIDEIYVEHMLDGEAAAEGATLGVWIEQQFRNYQDQLTESKVFLYDKGNEGKHKEMWEIGFEKAKAQNFSRYLTALPANIMTPTIFGQHCAEELCPCGVNVEVHDHNWIKSKDSDMHVVLWPLRLRLPHVCAQDFQSPSFQSSLSWDLSSNNLTVHVLPSLNQANVLMVSSHIPQNSLFKSYKELKRHWKNSYGYRLPENEEGMLYLTVKFGRWFSESLTYPIICARARRPVFLRQHEPQQVLLQVLADLHTKLPYICGFPFGVEATFRYALPKLNVLSEALFPANLTKIKPQIKKHEVEVKDEVDTIVVQNPSQPVSQYTQTQTSRVATQSYFKNRSSSPPPFLPQMSQRITPTPSRPLCVPVFTAKPKSHHHSAAPSSNLTLSPPSRHPQSAPTIPKFKGTPIKPMFGLAQPPPPPPLTIFNTNKGPERGHKPRNIAPFPMFNSVSGGPLNRPFNFAKGEKTLLHGPELTNKKVRNKPQVQQGLDVKALAFTRDGLAKVNTTTLIAYLRSEGVPCKVKDKKAELVAKVLTHLNLPLPSIANHPPATHTLSQDSEG